MSRVISKKHKGIEIPIGEISAKQNNVKNQTVIVFKVFHGSEEDLFIFYFNKLLKDWILNLELSLVSLSMKTNYRLIKEVYSEFKPSTPINIQEFTDLLLKKHFDIFVEANQITRTETRFSLIGLFSRLFNKKNK